MNEVSKKEEYYDDSSESSGEEFEASFILKLMFGYMYFLEGLLNSLAVTVPYIYPELPNYVILSYFSLSSIPFSFKFVTAPLVEKFSWISYGKRKTWIVINQFVTGIIILILSFLTDLSQASTFAFTLLFAFLTSSLQDIAMDGLALKQLRNANLMSTIQAAAQGMGAVFGGLILLKFTSLEFAQSIGLSAPISNLPTLILVIGLIFLVPLPLIHFFFQETFVLEETRSKNRSILQVYSYYRVHIFPSYRYFRIVIFVIFYSQGFNFFLAGYNYQLIKAGFSRDTMNTFDNINSLIVYAIAFCIGSKANILGLTRSLVLESILMSLVLFYLYFFFPLEAWVIALTSFIASFLATWDFIVVTDITAFFPPIGLTSMYFTMHASASNLGKMLFLQTAILDVWSWKTCALIGLILQLFLILLYPAALKWIESGETSIDSFYHREDDNDQDLQIEG